MSMAPPLPPLTLIVATTPSLGIGFLGSLPWPPLKADLAFFARVTKRAPPPGFQTAADSSNCKRTRNAVIMGRKTWDSLPPKARPLKGRINVVVSRNPASLGLPRKEDGARDGNGQGQGLGQDMVMGAGSIEEGLRNLQTMYAVSPSEQQQENPGRDTEQRKGQDQESEDRVGLGRVFVIGGAEIYKNALKMANCERVLWTRLAGEWECDVFFPEGTLPDSSKGDPDNHNNIWLRRTDDELDAWVGEECVSGLKKEGKVEFEVVMVQKKTA